MIPSAAYQLILPSYQLANTIVKEWLQCRTWALGKFFPCNMIRSWCTYLRGTAAGGHSHVPQCRMPHPGHPTARAHHVSKFCALYWLGVHPHAHRSQGNAGELTPHALAWSHVLPIPGHHTRPPYPTTMEPHHSHGHYHECLPTRETVK